MMSALAAFWGFGWLLTSALSFRHWVPERASAVAVTYASALALWPWFLWMTVADATHGYNREPRSGWKGSMMQTKTGEKVTVHDLTVVHFPKSGASILIKTPDGQKVFLPTSQIEYDPNAEVGDAIEVLMPEWLAKEKELI